MKTRFLLGVLLLFSITMQGQQVKVNYENITNSLPIILQEYFRMQGQRYSLWGFQVPQLHFSVRSDVCIHHEQGLHISVLPENRSA